MPYDRLRHQRRSIRLKDYDYAQNGAYFVTICVQARECVLAEIAADGKLKLSAFGEIVDWAWHALPPHHANLVLDAWVVMPNHVHGILFLDDGLNGQGRGEAFGREGSKSSRAVLPNASPLRPMTERGPHGTQPGSLAAIVQNFKSITSRRINAVRGTPGARFWQRNYWEHVIRDEKALRRLRHYIMQNPLHWMEDQLHPSAASNRFSAQKP